MSAASCAALFAGVVMVHLLLVLRNRISDELKGQKTAKLYDTGKQDWTFSPRGDRHLVIETAASCRRGGGAPLTCLAHPETENSRQIKGEKTSATYIYWT